MASPGFVFVVCSSKGYGIQGWHIALEVQGFADTT